MNLEEYLKRWTGNYVAHDCRNPKCNNGWVDKDLTDARNTPPKWKYCRECAEKLGIDYDSQTPESNLTPKQLASKEKRREVLKRVKEKIKSAEMREVKKKG